MPVSGLILTLAADPAQAASARADLQDDPRFALGQCAGSRLPVTLTTDDSDQDKACWHWLQAHRGIAFVDVACVFFDESEPAPEPAPELQGAAFANTPEPTRSR